MPYAQLEDIRVSYDGRTNVLENLDLDIEQGELVSLLGSSGCGKTTTLRVIAGFIEPTAGRFTLGGTDLTKTPVHKRNFGLVFQSYALFPHLTVHENVAFGLKLRGVKRDEVDRRVASMLGVTDLEAFSARYPKQLSGGQKQRVALARALVIEPQLLLLDEPLSNLDAKLRLSMRVEIRRIQRRLGITTVFVTHDQEECFSISDRVAIMNRGKIEQFDRPETIFSSPTNEFVARFIGFTNFIPLQRAGSGLYRAQDGTSFKATTDRGALEPVAAIRPDDIELASSSSGGENEVRGSVEVRIYLGKSYQYELSTPLGKIIANGPRERPFAPGAALSARFPADKIVVC
jgi:ABC-type spermidine/putrescine transport systems, ATPase components